MVARSGAVAAEIGGTDGLVRLLRILSLGGVDARFVRHVAGVVACRDRPPRAGDRFRRHVDAVGPHVGDGAVLVRSEEHTSELKSLMRISYAVFCLKKKITNLS